MYYSNYIQGEICIGSYFILLYKFKMNQITLNMTYRKVEGGKRKKKKQTYHKFELPKMCYFPFSKYLILPAEYYIACHRRKEKQ